MPAEMRLFDQCSLGGPSSGDRSGEPPGHCLYDGRRVARYDRGEPELTLLT
jgi:hypothetical protein